MALTADCQRCSEPFDYRHDACPNCGWRPETWRQGGRYGLGRTGLGERN
jgi:predicted amidophosphoribosyltransferase